MDNAGIPFILHPVRTSLQLLANISYVYIPEEVDII